MIITNLDAWDRREFLDCMQYDQKLKDVEIDGSKRQPNFAEFMIDIFGGLYKYEPKLREEDQKIAGTEWMDEIYNEISQLQEWKTLRERTRMNGGASAEATAEFCLQFMDQVPKPPKKNQQQQPQPQQQQQGQPQQGGGAGSQPKPPGLDMSKIRQAARNACKKATEAADRHNSMMSAFGQGNETGVRQTTAPGLKKQLAEKLVNNEHLRKIAELAGRMKRLAIQKQKSKTRYGTDEIANITVGDELSRLVPSEIAKLSHPVLKKDFFKRYLEKSLLQYQLRGREKEGRGPLIVCIDESGTMSGQRDIWAKAVAMALLHIAQRQKRRYFMIHYDSNVTRTDEFFGTVDPLEIIDAISHYTAGGTEFEEPLNMALQMINKGKETGYKKADIVFITDGQATVSDQFLQIFNMGKKVANFQVIGVAIDCRDVETLKKFSDQLIHVWGGRDDEALNIMFDV
ncbi:MAG: vWA domain-containing protein [bacterium]